MIDIQRLQRGSDCLLVVEFDGRLTEREHKVFLPHFESEIRHHKDLRLLFLLADRMVWDVDSSWRRLRFDSRHRTSILKLAVVGGGSVLWHFWLAPACKPLSIATTLRFKNHERAEAASWVLT